MSDPRGHEEIEGLLGAYALDAVDPEERLAVERHLPQCPRCAAEVHDHLAVAGLLGSVGESPPDGLWDRIAPALDERPPGVVPFPLERSRSTGDRRGLVLAGGLGVAAALLVGLLTWRVVEQQSQIDDLDEEVAVGQERQAAAGLIAEPGTALMTFEDPDGEAIARAVVGDDGEGYLLGEPLPELAAGQTYQLWSIDGDETISLAVLGPEPDVAGFHVGTSADQLALTAEPDGGSVTPEGPVVADAEFA